MLTKKEQTIADQRKELAELADHAEVCPTCGGATLCEHAPGEWACARAKCPDYSKTIRLKKDNR